MMKKYLTVFLVAALGAVAGTGVTKFFEGESQTGGTSAASAEQVYHLSNLHTSTGAHIVENPDFVRASAAATPAVVHVKSYVEGGSDDPFGGYFNSPPSGFPRSTGSGVIISADGYIATNNHVIEKSDKIEVVLNDKRSYIAELVGRDPTTDLALLKIEEAGLAYLGFGNSNDVQVGEWVLAVGNPFNLTSTVTAGIVSAKGRNLNLLNEEFAIESFIQTDAAVNPGNSGGALINTRGQLVGINTAIASETGSYAGYSFAVPSNIVKKVMEDLREYGKVQRGIIGVQIQNINSQFAESKGLSTLDGAYVSGTIKGGAAAAAGIREGDVILEVDGSPIRSASELQEVIALYRPGDKVKIKVLRGDATKHLDLTLRNRLGTTDLSARRDDEPVSGPAFGEATPAGTDLGVEMSPLTENEKSHLGVENGVKVTRVTSDRLREMGISEGFIITKVNRSKVDSPSEVSERAANTEGSVLIEGIDSEGRQQFFAFDF